MLEKDIEKAVKRYAESKGVLIYKFAGVSAVKAAPECMFIAPNGKVFFIKFKQKIPNKAEFVQIEKLRSQNVPVYVVDRLELGQWVIDQIIERSA